jgi:hypothetical protein
MYFKILDGLPSRLRRRSICRMSHHIAKQVHDKFKIFSGELAAAIKLHCIRLGKVHVEGNDFSALEEKMAKAGGQHANIICHELYVTGGNDFTVVVMTHEAK